MKREPQLSEKIKESVEQYLVMDPDAKKIDDIQKEIDNKQQQIYQLEAELSVIEKTRPEINIEYRKSIMWCLEIDSDNPWYFLKSKEGLVKCVEYKHKIKLTPKQNNSFGGILSGMFKDGLIGRITHPQFDMFFYGLTSLFETDEQGLFTILKKKHEKNLSSLRQVNK